MTDYFKSEYLTQSLNLRLRIKRTYFFTVILYILISVGLFIWYRGLPYKSATITVVKVIEYALTVVFVIFSFLYMGIKYKRAKKYNLMCYNLTYGLKEQSVLQFIKTDDTMHDKDGVECKSLVFSEWNKYKKEYFNRKVYVFYDLPFPDIKENEKYKIITQGNFLISYEQEDGGELNG